MTEKTKLIAYCGLYCGECSKYKKGKCPGCSENTKASWCKIRSCGIENNLSSCSECKEHKNVKDCKKYHNKIARVIEFFSGTDRSKCIEMIKNKGSENFVAYMETNKIMSIKKK